MISKNVYECVYLGNTSDLSKAVLRAAQVQLVQDKKDHLDDLTKLLALEVRDGSVAGAVQAKLSLEKTAAKYASIETKLSSLLQ